MSRIAINDLKMPSQPILFELSQEEYERVQGGFLCLIALAAVAFGVGFGTYKLTHE